MTANGGSTFERVTEAEMRLLVNFHEEASRSRDSSADFKRIGVISGLQALRSYGKGLVLPEEQVRRLREGESHETRGEIVLATLRGYTVAQLAMIIDRLPLDSGALDSGLGRDARSVQKCANENTKSVI